jgi:hypothetical protein
MLYVNDAQKGYFIKQPSLINYKLFPYQLKVEETQQSNIKNNARLLIRGNEKNKSGNYTFFTGMLSTSFKNWYCGNISQYHKGKKTNSLILFYFSVDYSILNVFYFSNYDKSSIDMRIQLANNIIPQLILENRMVA